MIKNLIEEVEKVQEAGFDKEITKYNLRIHQLLNLSSLDAMLKLAKEVELAAKTGKTDGLAVVGKMIREFFMIQKKNQPKLLKMVRDFEKTMSSEQRVKAPKPEKSPYNPNRGY